jgi:cation diffusion facilitator family transporter
MSPRASSPRLLGGLEGFRDLGGAATGSGGGTLGLRRLRRCGIRGVQRLEVGGDVGLGEGLAVSVLASLVNLVVALLLLRVGRKRNSITLEANAQHLLTDVWTSVGVVVGVTAVALTGWQRLDPIVALGVAANIIWTGVGIVRRSTAGLMDSALSAEDQAAVQRVLQTHQEGGVQFHKLQTRQAGARKFVSVHVLVPSGWTVDRGHALAGRIASDIRQALPEAHVITHLEPLDAPGPAAPQHAEPKRSDA